MDDKSLDDICSFIRFTLQFREVERIILHQDKDSWENDAEHSYQMALFAWYLMERDSVPLDKNKVIQLSLIHDLVETYAGDTFIYGPQDRLNSKKQREQEAATRIAREFPDFPSLHTLIIEYEEMNTDESRYVHAVDKLLPMFNIYLDKGRTWHQKDIDYDQAIALKEEITKLSPYVAPYYLALKKQLKQQSKELFVNRETSK